MKTPCSAKKSHRLRLASPTLAKKAASKTMQKKEQHSYKVFTGTKTNRDNVETLAVPLGASLFNTNKRAGTTAPKASGRATMMAGTPARGFSNASSILSIKSTRKLEVLSEIAAQGEAADKRFSTAIVDGFNQVKKAYVEMGTQQKTIHDANARRLAEWKKDAIAAIDDESGPPSTTHVPAVVSEYSASSTQFESAINGSTSGIATLSATTPSNNRFGGSGNFPTTPSKPSAASSLRLAALGLKTSGMDTLGTSAASKPSFGASFPTENKTVLRGVCNTLGNTNNKSHPSSPKFSDSSEAEQMDQDI